MNNTGKKVCVIGAGRIGLPLAVVIAEAGHKVNLVDKNKDLINKIENKEPPFYEPKLLELMKKYVGVFIHPTTDLKKGIEDSEIVFVAIGSGITKDQKPDLANLFKLVDEISNFKIKNKLIIFKSTLPMGTTNKIKKKIEDNTNLVGGKDFYLAFCPERIVEGKAIDELKRLPKIVGGIDKKSGDMTADFMASIGGEIVRLKNATSAELVKLIDNSYRITRFGFANDLAYISELYNLNVYDIIDAANRGYDRNNIPYPSCGVGGYCLTKDPYYLEDGFEQVIKKRGFGSLWFYARRSNDHRVEHTVTQIINLLKKKNIPIKDSEILICGITYKENIDDIRNSHGVLLANRLKEYGAKVSVWDSWANVENGNLDFHIYKNPFYAFEGKDVAVFTIPHDEFKEVARNGKIKDLTSHMRNKIIFDGWGLFKNSKFGNSTIYFGTGLPNSNNW